MKIATWNVNSISARLPLVLTWLESKRPDVVCLQETKCVDAKFPADAFAQLGYSIATHGQPTYNGVAIASILPIENVVRGFPDDDEAAQSRAIAATVGGIRILNVYVPNGSEVGSEKFAYKLTWLGRLRAYLDGHFQKDTDVLICGDFNVAPEDRDVHDPKAWVGNVLVSPAERRALARISAWGFKDAFRMHNEKTGLYSWWNYRQMAFTRNAGLRIDHVWVTASLADKCSAAWIDQETRAWERPSDHAPVVAEFES